MDGDKQAPPPETILFVEDDVLARLDMSEFLRQSIYRVSEAGHAGEAIDALNAKFAIDLVVTDVGMPGDMDGLVLARWIKDNRPGVQVIVQTGDVDVQIPDDLQEFGPILRKPYTGATSWTE
ncbi:MAG TPA: response regulator [Roseiarcus sp.]|nr:response regulator [Roseiarcus sp.]